MKTDWAFLSKFSSLKSLSITSLILSIISAFSCLSQTLSDKRLSFTQKKIISCLGAFLSLLGAILKMAETGGICRGILREREKNRERDEESDKGPEDKDVVVAAVVGGSAAILFFIAFIAWVIHLLKVISLESDNEEKTRKKKNNVRANVNGYNIETHKLE